MMKLITIQGGEAPEMKPQPAEALFEATRGTLSGIAADKVNYSYVHAQRLREDFVNELVRRLGWPERVI